MTAPRRSSERMRIKLVGLADSLLEKEVIFKEDLLRILGARDRLHRLKKLHRWLPHQEERC